VNVHTITRMIARLPLQNGKEKNLSGQFDSAGQWPDRMK
jgi:hypothetical protein